MYGVVRCSVCVADFCTGDRLKQFPGCNHIFHIRCLDLWLSIEGKCPNCKKDFPGETKMDQNCAEIMQETDSSELPLKSLESLNDSTESEYY
jgi:hypothetical protein